MADDIIAAFYALLVLGAVAAGVRMKARGARRRRSRGASRNARSTPPERVPGVSSTTAGCSATDRARPSACAASTRFMPRRCRSRRSSPFAPRSMPRRAAGGVPPAAVFQAGRRSTAGSTATAAAIRARRWCCSRAWPSARAGTDRRRGRHRRGDAHGRRWWRRCSTAEAEALPRLLERAASYPLAQAGAVIRRDGDGGRLRLAASSRAITRGCSR